MTPRLECGLERLAFMLQMEAFDADKRLKKREKQYCMSALNEPGGVLIVRETDEGWWFESHSLRDDRPIKQLEKFKTDPTVACGWFNTNRFNEQGGWYDPT